MVELFLTTRSASGMVDSIRRFVESRALTWLFHDGKPPQLSHVRRQQVTVDLHERDDVLHAVIDGPRWEDVLFVLEKLLSRLVIWFGTEIRELRVVVEHRGPDTG